MQGFYGTRTPIPNGFKIPQRSRPAEKKSQTIADMLRYIYREQIHDSGQKLSDLENWYAVTLFFSLCTAVE